MIKKYNIIIRQQFYEELENIIYYSLSSPKSKKNLYQKIKTSISHLDYFPERFYKISHIPKYKNLNIHKLPIDKYVIIYQVNKDLKEVYVLHIFYGNQNYFKNI